MLASDKIRAIREHVSQPVFAAYLDVSRNLVSDWERGVKRPRGPALRLLSIIQRKACTPSPNSSSDPGREAIPWLSVRLLVVFF